MLTMIYIYNVLYCLYIECKTNLSINLSIYLHIVADLCHVVLSCFRGEKAKRRHAKTRQMVTLSCFRMATLHPATRKYDTSCVAFLPLFVVSVPGGAKRARKPAQITILCVFAWPKSPFGVFSRGDLSPRQAKI